MGFIRWSHRCFWTPLWGAFLNGCRLDCLTHLDISGMKDIGTGGEDEKCGHEGAKSTFIDIHLQARMKIFRIVCSCLHHPSQTFHYTSRGTASTMRALW
ncbi:hypothetical protein BDP27DRAFT_1329708 [Rhodocollybia butyracea]|uniref:Secreted protein n=1 Tax=Rhodocollybia butyracea TaxID=206335 RepID=A0A9P5U6K3_9AGAR|nr:hypothetical protein BDP27DRAFT_1329708 [Rhodocollybia butyracea]